MTTSSGFEVSRESITRLATAANTTPRISSCVLQPIEIDWSADCWPDASMVSPRIRKQAGDACPVLFAHPLADSFAAALHHAVVGALAEAGHEVDDCDLYAIGFDPVMTAAERRAHNTPNPDLSAVENHVERLRAADAVVLCFPVWWYGMPAILKGYFDRVWINGVAFHLRTGGKIEPGLHRLKKLGVVATYGAPWWLIKLALRDPVRAVIHTGSVPSARGT